MPNILPGAVWQPVDVGNRAARRKGRGVIGHVAVSSSKNLRPGPLNTRPSDWHFYLPKEGPAIQQIDMDLQCWSSGDANPTCVAWESEGGLGDSRAVNAEPLTDNQLNWAARILRHLHDTEGVPLRLMQSSRPEERGQGWHRLGIQHSRGLGAVPGWRIPGGESWSSKVGKECPGDTKIRQMAEIPRRASGTPALPPAQELEEDDVPTIVNVANGGIWLRDGAGYDWISDTATVASLKAAGAKEIQVSRAEHDNWVNQQAARHQPPAAVDSEVLAAAVKEALAGVELPPVQVDAAAFARAFHDEADRRARDGDPATGPVS